MTFGSSSWNGSSSERSCLRTREGELAARRRPSSAAGPAPTGARPGRSCCSVRLASTGSRSVCFARSPRKRVQLAVRDVDPERHLVPLAPHPHRGLHGLVDVRRSAELLGRDAQLARRRDDERDGLAEPLARRARAPRLVVSPPTSSPPIVTPGWISFGPRGGTARRDRRRSSRSPAARSSSAGAVVVDGVVSSAAAIGASTMKSATEQGRTAAVASRRIGLSVSRALVGGSERTVMCGSPRRSADRS